jgi:two-component system chemotaxis response regulator CheB
MSALTVIGGSAGGVEALTSVVEHLPPQMREPVLAVIHVPANYRSRLPEILQRHTSLDVAHATDGEKLRPGIVRIAPPDHHLLVVDGRIRLSRGPRENRHRPSIDVLFRSAVRWHGREVTALLLSGGPGDGVGGLSLVKAAGGVTLVQDPAYSFAPALPEDAIENVEPDFIGSAAELGARVAELADQPRANRTATAHLPEPQQLHVEAQGEMAGVEMAGSGWKPSGFACPDCNGALWELDDGKLIRFRCRVGHMFAAEALVHGQAEELEEALWSAINVMEERGELTRRLADRAAQSGFDETSQRYRRTSQEMHEQAAQIRALLASEGGFGLEPGDEPPAVASA